MQGGSGVCISGDSGESGESGDQEESGVGRIGRVGGIGRLWRTGSTWSLENREVRESQETRKSRKSRESGASGESGELGEPRQRMNRESGGSSDLPRRYTSVPKGGRSYVACVCVRVCVWVGGGASFWKTFFPKRLRSRRVNAGLHSRTGARAQNLHRIPWITRATTCIGQDARVKLRVVGCCKQNYVSLTRHLHKDNIRLFASTHGANTINMSTIALRGADPQHDGRRMQCWFTASEQITGVYIYTAGGSSAPSDAWSSQTRLT